MFNPIGIGELQHTKKKKILNKNIQGKPRPELMTEEQTADFLNKTFNQNINNTELIVEPIHVETIHESSLPVDDSSSLIENEFETLEEGQLSVDVYQTNKEIVITALIAGVEKNDIQIAITDDILSIKGTRLKEKKIPDNAYLTQECFWGVFSRSIVLPAAVDKNKIKASYTKNGLLTISIPKIKIERSRIIHIAD